MVRLRVCFRWRYFKQKRGAGRFTDEQTDHLRRRDVPVEKIADLMIANKIKRVPVLSGEKLVGIVSRADIIRAIAMGKHIAMHTPIYDL
jgi:predicted transcriptional regulator